MRQEVPPAFHVNPTCMIPWRRHGSRRTTTPSTWPHMKRGHTACPGGRASLVPPSVTPAPDAGGRQYRAVSRATGGDERSGCHLHLVQVCDVPRLSRTIDLPRWA